MGNGDAEWVGLPFLVLHHHDGRRIGAPGLFGFVRREPSGERTLLYIDHADWIAHVAHGGHRAWSDALALGMSELHVCLQARERVDRLQLRARIVTRLEPLLNVLEDQGGGARPVDLPTAPARPPLVHRRRA